MDNLQAAVVFLFQLQKNSVQILHTPYILKMYLIIYLTPQSTYSSIHSEAGNNLEMDIHGSFNDERGTLGLIGHEAVSAPLPV
jgi:hypothetical protein